MFRRMTRKDREKNSISDSVPVINWVDYRGRARSLRAGRELILARSSARQAAQGASRWKCYSEAWRQEDDGKQRSG